MQLHRKYPALLLLLIASCSGGAVKEKLNQAGDVAGQTVGEIATGVASGVRKALDLKVELGDSLKKHGIRMGRVELGDSSGMDNVLAVYLIFDKDFEGTLTARAFDNTDAEMGRVRLNALARKDEARFFEFRFDPRTHLDNDCRITID